MTTKTPVRLESPLPPEQVLQRLQALTVSQFALFKSRTTYPLSGTVSGAEIVLRWRNWYRNDYQRQLKLNFAPAVSGSVLVGEFDIPVVRKAILIIATVILILLQVVMAISYFTGADRGAHRADDWIFLFPTGLLIASSLALTFGLWLSSKSEPKVYDLLQHAVGAAVLTGQGLGVAPPPLAAGGTPFVTSDSGLLHSGQGSIEPR